MTTCLSLVRCLCNEYCLFILTCFIRMQWVDDLWKLQHNLDNSAQAKKTLMDSCRVTETKGSFLLIAFSIDRYWLIINIYMYIYVTLVNVHRRECKYFLITLGPIEERNLISGLHTVNDIYCSSCQQILGWRYVSWRILFSLDLFFFILYQLQFLEMIEKYTDIF